MRYSYVFDNACAKDRERRKKELRELKLQKAKENAAPNLYAACIKAKRALLHSNHHTAYNAVDAALEMVLQEM